MREARAAHLDVECGVRSEAALDGGKQRVHVARQVAGGVRDLLRVRGRGSSRVID